MRPWHGDRHLAAPIRTPNGECARARLEVRLKDQVTVLDRARRIDKKPGRADRLYHPARYCRRKTASRSEALSSAIRILSSCRRPQTTTVLWDKAEDFAAATLQSGGRTFDDGRAAPGRMGFFVSVLKKA